MYSKEFAIKKWNNNWSELSDIASLEEEICIEFAGQEFKLLACPINLEELCLGHILLDHIQKKINQVPDCAFSAQITKLNQHRYAVQVTKNPPCPAQELTKINAYQIFRIMQDFMGRGGKWDDTGSFHRAAIVDLSNQKLIHFAEDIGRHNCVDRLAGYAALNNLDLRNYALFISSRITATLFSKARLAGFRFMVSRSAVTSFAVEKAQAEGITLIAFARDKEKRLSIFADSNSQVDYSPAKLALKNALVLAGGLSKRLGQDKTLMRLHGQEDMLARTVKLLQNVSENIYVSCRRDSNLEGYKFIYDLENSEGPLVGILSALRELKTAFLVLSCDLPFMNIEILEQLITKWQQRPSGTLLTTFRQANTGYIEALVAIYEPEALTFFEEAHKKGLRQLNQVIPENFRQDIIYTNDEALSFFNINYPADLEIAKQYLKSSKRNEN